MYSVAEHAFGVQISFRLLCLGSSASALALHQINRFLIFQAYPLKNLSCHQPLSSWRLATSKLRPYSNIHPPKIPIALLGRISRMPSPANVQSEVKREKVHFSAKSYQGDESVRHKIGGISEKLVDRSCPVHVKVLSVIRDDVSPLAAVELKIEATRQTGKS